MSDPMGQPEGEGMELAFPFVACQSHGGPYADDPFVAGYQAGRIDTALAAAASIGAATATYTVLTALVPQLDLIAMHHGFATAEAERHDAAPEWSLMTFAVAPATP